MANKMCLRPARNDAETALNLSPLPRVAIERVENNKSLKKAFLQIWPKVIQHVEETSFFPTIQEANPKNAPLMSNFTKGCKINHFLRSRTLQLEFSASKSLGKKPGGEYLCGFVISNWTVLEVAMCLMDWHWRVYSNVKMRLAPERHLGILEI